MVQALQRRSSMRISSLSPFLVVAALAAPARADRQEPRPARATQKVAALAPRAERTAGSLTTGDLGITGSPGATRDARPAPFLAADEITAEVRPYAPEIERCYLERLDDVRRAGRLELRFVIGRDGSVVSLSAAAPGLPARTARRVESCIREAVDALHFPVRRNDTTAIVPYYFQHTDTPGGGPQLSCWDPKGCR
jgi:hypothetical protein